MEGLQLVMMIKKVTAKMWCGGGGWGGVGKQYLWQRQLRLLLHWPLASVETQVFAKQIKIEFCIHKTSALVYILGNTLYFHSNKVCKNVEA